MHKIVKLVERQSHQLPKPQPGLLALIPRPLKSRKMSDSRWLKFEITREKLLTILPAVQDHRLGKFSWGCQLIRLCFFSTQCLISFLLPLDSIGWRHLDSRVVHVNHYEHSRPYRKGQLELVLTREEREALLAEWGVSTQDIVSSTRALIKAKNQRRQTVRNLNKAERVEEGLEKATRTLLRLLSLRKSTKVELEQLQRQAEFAAALSPARFEEVDEPEETKQTQSEGEVSSSSSRAEITEKEDGVLGDFEVKLGPSVGPGNISQERTVVKDEMDTISCISGFTLGNSTTASALEIERFHRELELELFGDQELPSMVGQTLEVDVEIPEEDKVFHDPSPICGTQEPPSVLSDSINPESLPHGSYGNHIPSHRYPTMYHPPPINPLEQQSLPRPNFHNGQVYDSYGNYQMQIRGHTANYEFRLPGSLDSATEANGFIGKSPDTHTNFEATRQPHAPYNLAQASSNYATGSRWTDVTPKVTVNQPTDGPLVTHVPLASHLSPNNWMEGSHSQFRSSPSRTPWDAVIISEDDLDEVQQHYVEQASMMPLFHG